MSFPTLDSARYEAERALLDRVYDAMGGKGDPAERIALIRSVVANGADATYAAATRRMRSDKSKQFAAAALTETIAGFNALGARAFFVPPSGRAGDFLINYRRGEWAEQIMAQGLESTGEYVLVRYGPSTPPMPGEEAFRMKCGIFGLITALEGKRPDGLLFDSRTFQQLDPAAAALATGELAEVPEDEAVASLVNQAVAAIEIKSSVWLAKARPEGKISVTVKAEELTPFDSWQARYGKPILFAQVFFDSICLLNYRTIKRAIRDRHLDGFPLSSEGATERLTDKGTYRVPLARTRFFADVPFPSGSEAKFMFLNSGKVLPYIHYNGAAATNLNLTVLRECIHEQ